MNEIFSFLNSTYEAGHTILGGRGKIIGYAYDGSSIDGLFHIDNEDITYSISEDDDLLETPAYSLRLERKEHVVTYKHLSSPDIIRLFDTGDSPIFQ